MNIYIMAYLHERLHHGIPIRGHLHHDIPTWTFTSWHPYKKHLHHDMPIRRHLHHKTFCISIFVRRHLHCNLNMCAGTIMDKFRICTPAWDICIMKITSLKGEHVHHMDILHLHHCEKTFASEMKNLDLHHILFAFIRKLTSRSVVKSLSIA